MNVWRTAFALAACLVLFTAGCKARHGPTSSATAARTGATRADIRAGRASARDAVEPLEYVEYRLQPELGQIAIVIGSVEGPRTVERVRRSADALAGRGILVCAGGSPRAVYRRAGRPCGRCGTPIESRGQGNDNRTAYWCPVCQPLR